MVGCIYNDRIGIIVDKEKAISCYRQAADMNYALAENSLGCCYANGNGVKRDVEQAFHWYSLSADQGYSWLNLT